VSNIAALQWVKNFPFLHNSTVEIPREKNDLFVALSTHFADELNHQRQSAGFYRDEREATKALQDIILGKYGEFATAYFLRKNLDFPPTVIDCEIREGPRKGWQVDLPYKSMNPDYPDVHVKTCDDVTCAFLRNNGTDRFSWTFQYANKSGKGGRDKLFDNPNSPDLIALVYTPRITAAQFTMVATAPWKRLHKLLKLPIKDALKPLKRCIYYADIAKF
jgi:hypothetical protein